MSARCLHPIATSRLSTRQLTFRNDASTRGEPSVGRSTLSSAAAASCSSTLARRWLLPCCGLSRGPAPPLPLLGLPLSESGSGSGCGGPPDGVADVHTLCTEPTKRVTSSWSTSRRLASHCKRTKGRPRGE
jgi:hypothetical protein